MKPTNHENDQINLYTAFTTSWHVQDLDSWPSAWSAAKILILYFALRNTPLGAWVITNDGPRFHVSIFSGIRRGFVSEMRFYLAD